MKTFIYNVRLVDASFDADGAVLCDNGFISDVFIGHAQPDDITVCTTGERVECIDGKGLVLMPAFVDMHAHFRYPGQSQKEELGTALKAASAGGFGTLLLMPNAEPIVSSSETARQICAEAAKYGLADVIQTLSITKDFSGTDTSHLDDLNCTQTPVITEDGRDVESAAVMLEAMKKCGENSVIVSCHSEDTALAAAAKAERAKAIELLKTLPQNFDSARRTTTQQNAAAGGAAYQNTAANTSANADAPNATQSAQQITETLKAVYRHMRAAERLLAAAEDTATERNLILAEEADCEIHIAHVSTKRALEAVQQSKVRRSKAVTCEVTPHHIALSGDTTEFVNPPIRGEQDRRALIEGIKNGTVDVIATDHAPHTAEDKANGACGFSGLETAFSVCYTALVQTGAVSLSKLSALMSANPAKTIGVNCGLLRPGRQADFVLVDIAKNWVVRPEKFYSKGKNTPYKDKTLTAKVVHTFRRGKLIFSAE